MSLTNNSYQSLTFDKKWECPLHKGNNRQILYLSVSIKNHRICQECKLENKIDDNEIISISDLLNLDENFYFSAFPIVSGQQSLLSLKNLLKQYDDDSPSIQEFFLQFPNDLNVKRLLGVARESKDLYKQRIAQMNQLKQAVESFTLNAENNIHEIIVNHFKSRTNSVQIQKAAERFSLAFSKFYEKVSNNIIYSRKIIKKLGFKRMKTKELLSLFQGVIKYENIFELDIDHQKNSIGAKGVNFFSVSLSHLSSLHFLQIDLQSNNISYQGAESLSQALKKLTNLVSLSLILKNNNINNDGALSLSSALIHIKNLNYLRLDIESNQINEQGVISLFLGLSLLKNLTLLQLNLNSMKIGEREVESLCFALNQLQHLNLLSLDLQHNQINENGAEVFFLALSQLNNMNTLCLNLSNNNIGEKGVESLSSALNQLKNLNSMQLNLSSNNINSIGAESLSQALSQLKYLKSLQLYLYSNYLDYQGAESLTSTLFHLQNLREKIFRY